MWAEFLDESHFDRPLPPIPSELTEKVILVPLEWVRRIAQVGQLKRARADVARLQKLTLEGVRIRRPLKIVVDHNSKIVLEDGHHRIIHADIHKLQEVPVRFVRSDKIRVQAADATEMLLELVTS